MKQSFHEADLPPEEVALHNVLRVTGNLAFLPFAAALAGSTVLPRKARTGLWHAFVLTHAVQAGALVALRQRHVRSGNGFSLVSKTIGPIGYTAVAALTVADLPPGPPPPRGWRRSLQRAGHNVLLGMYAFTIGHGYRAKGRRAAVYGPLGVLWIAAAGGMDHAWRSE